MLFSVALRLSFSWIIWLVVSSSHFAAYCQRVSFEHIEDRVYQHNNALQYKQSQALLLPVLDNAAYNTDEQYQAAILLSYTYKRLQDYATTIQFLDKAEQLALGTTQPSKNRANVKAQQAFAYFDIRQYDRAHQLMQSLTRTGFAYINQEDKAKLIHQQGYLLFLAKKYGAAETMYDRALSALRVASPCDAPMILVKKMQLYAAMNRMDFALVAFGQANRCADSCGISKYRIYACSELIEIYKNRGDKTGVGTITPILDSLNKVYARAENIATLHNQKEAILQEASEQQRDQLAVGLKLLGVTAASLLAGLLLYRKRQRHLAVEAEKMRTQLAQREATNQPSLPVPIRIESALTSNLSDRQRQVLTYLVEGRSNREIADLMSVSENTVKYHIKNIYEELDIKNRKELLTRTRDYKANQ